MMIPTDASARANTAVTDVAGKSLKNLHDTARETQIIRGATPGAVTATEISRPVPAAVAPDPTMALATLRQNPDDQPTGPHPTFKWTPLEQMRTIAINTAPASTTATLSSNSYTDAKNMEQNANPPERLNVTT